MAGGGATTVGRMAQATVKRTFSEADLSCPRRKPRSISVALLYRVTRSLDALFGTSRTLKWLANLAWTSHRLAYEQSDRLYGQDFKCSNLALTEVRLLKWVPRNSAVLDFGCGIGRWTRVVGEVARVAVGIDHNDASIVAAQRATQSERVHFAVGQTIADGLRFVENRHYDVVLLIHVIEHIDDVDALLEELRHCASTLIVEVPDFEADPLNAVRWVLSARWYSDGDHVREYTFEVLSEQLARNGWVVADTERRCGAMVVRAVPECSAVGDGKTEAPLVSGERR